MSHTIVACEPLRVAVVTGQDLLWLGLQQAMTAAAHLHLVGHAHSLEATSVLLLHAKPQVVLIDTESTCDLPALVRLIKEVAVDAKIVALCGLGGECPTGGRVPVEVDAIVLTVQPAVVLIATIDSLGQSAQPEERLIAGRLLNLASGEVAGGIVKTAPAEKRWPNILTEREREVILGIGQGLSNKDIAALLGISDITVRHHVTSIFDKLGVKSRQQLLLYGHRSGLFVLPCLD